METSTIKQAAEKLLQRTSSLPQYKEITLSPDEYEEALRKGRKEKFYQQRAEKYWEKADQDITPAVMTSQQYFEWVIQRAVGAPLAGAQEWGVPKEFNIEEGRYEVYKELAKYFTGEDCKYSKYKGILLQGNVGSGKTFIMKLFSNNPRKSFHIIDCVKLAGEYGMLDEHRQPIGEKLITKFRNELGPKAFDPWKHQYCGCLFDDLGWEEILKHFGNEVNVMERIINGIYSASLPFSSYHATTNLTQEELETKYGSRIMSRLNEMFNFIILPGKDLRK